MKSNKLLNNIDYINLIESRTLTKPSTDIVQFQTWPEFGERIQHFSKDVNFMRPASVLIPIMTSGDEPYVLLTERSRHMTNHPGQISFPGGSRDANETVLAAAVREAQEEIGLPPA